MMVEAVQKVQMLSGHSSLFSNGLNDLTGLTDLSAL